jgi:hypothetical protein
MFNLLLKIYRMMKYNSVFVARVSLQEGHTDVDMSTDMSKLIKVVVLGQGRGLLSTLDISHTITEYTRSYLLRLTQLTHTHSTNSLTYTYFYSLTLNHKH